MNLNEQWLEYIKEDSYADPNDFIRSLGYSQVQSEIVEEWRWGNVYENVYIDQPNHFVGLSYRDSLDGELDSSNMRVEFYPVEAHQVITIKYVRQ